MAKKRSALTHILLALIPYSRQNLLLSFSPNRFFNELERNSGYSQPALKVAYKRAQQRGLIEKSKVPKLSPKGFKEIKPFTASYLESGAQLMVIFDIPENRAADRQRFRAFLKSWQFKQVQKSVWTTELDHRESLVDAITELKLGRFVEIYECAKLYPYP